MRPLILMLFVLLISCTVDKTDKCNPEQLLCEYLINPLGVDAESPRLKWRIRDTRQGAIQYAYQLRVGTDSLAVQIGSGNMWDSQKVVSEDMLVSYEGKALEAFTKYYWAVQVWDKDHIQSSISEVASFETGLMHMNNWQGA